MNNNSNIIEVNESNFNEKIVEASDEKLIIVDFWAPWCGPCKQLTPSLEKIVKKGKEKIVLAKINIDENQQIASQLRIQSIPTVLAFKKKQIVNAFQGVISEKQIIEFIEKALGEKLEEDFSEFYETIEKKIKTKNYTSAKEILLDFITNHPKEFKAISLYLSCLIGLAEYEEAEAFKNSIDSDAAADPDIQAVLKRLEITKKNNEGPSLENLFLDLNSKPNNLSIIFKIADKYFANSDYENTFDILIKNYPKNKEKIKNKILELFSALGHTHEATIEYRKKLSQIMFS